MTKIYASNKITTEDMKALEEKDKASKDEWDIIVEHFNNKMAAMDIYLNNASRADKVQYNRTENSQRI